MSEGVRETVIFIMGIILCALLAGAFVSAWRLHRRQWAGLKTRYIEQSDYTWVCEQCDFTTCFAWPWPEDLDWNHCQKCGRKVAEFVPYREEDADA